MTHSNPAASNALGTVGAVFWSIQLIPQIIKSHRSKSTAGLSTHLLGCWAIAGIWMGTYNIVQGLAIPLVVQPEAFTVLCTISWAQCLHYSCGWKRNTAIAWVFGFCSVVAGLQVAFVHAARAGLERGITEPVTLFGALSAVFILGGVLPQYWEVYRYKAVVGLSLVFLSIDLLGGLASCLSLVFEPKFDVLASVSYGGIVVLEIGIFVLAAVLNPRMRRKERREKELSEETGVEGVEMGRMEAQGVGTGVEQEKV